MMLDKRQTKEIPRLSGVYQLRCITTGQIYIGSAVELRARWIAHRRALRRCEHVNRFLQEAWDHYGEADFDFSVLELVADSERLQAEQSWIDRTDCTDRTIGFNIYPTAGSPGELNAHLWEGFIGPDGNEISIFNLHEFCRLHGLDFPSMHRLAMGKSKLKSYKGWTHKNSVRKRDYVKTYDGFIDPEGSPIGPITNLAAFCRERGLDNTHMVALVNGRICSHRGWTYLKGRQNKHKLRRYTGFVSPNGQSVVITNLKAFCQDKGLGLAHMHQVKSGKRKSHKGWTWRKNEK